MNDPQRQAVMGKRYRVLITGSSGQIGTNLALRLLAEGHQVFGVDWRVNTWTDAFPTLLQDLAAPQHIFVGGIGGAPYPTCDIVIHLRAISCFNF